VLSELIYIFIYFTLPPFYFYCFFIFFFIFIFYSIFIFIAQLFAKKFHNPHQKYSIGRTLRMATVGGFAVGPTITIWWVFLERKFPGQSTIQVLKKWSLDQFLFGPFILSINMSAASLLQGLSLQQTKEKLETNLIPAFKTVRKFGYVLEFEGFFFTLVLFPYNRDCLFGR
jgi:hypothetical protein